MGLLFVNSVLLAVSMINRSLALAVFFPCLTSALSAEPAAGLVDFVRDVEPLLAAHCYRCHGAKEQEGQLRLDAGALSLRGGVSGPLWVAGRAADSLLVKRLINDSEGDQMPLDGDPLGAADVELIRRWIDQGAVLPPGYAAPRQMHWAYRPPERPALPTVNSAWVRNPVDAFVLKRLREHGLSPSRPADLNVLLRRVSLDLIGLPPTVEQLDRVLADPRPWAYDAFVDSLLASPQYGARWARPWLDAARYADSNGYQADQYRNVWPYRDWVIRAMNADLPFDQFTIEQIAGDLLAAATLANKIATGFHRLTTCNVEAGVDPEENRVNQIIDRVNTTGTVWLGTTIECAQCHNHKYDPFSQRDYYRLFAYFNNTPLEVDGNGVTYNFVGPKLELPLTAEQEDRRLALQAQLERATAAHKERLQEQQALLSASAAPSAVPAGIAKILALRAADRSGPQSKRLHKYLTGQDPRIQELQQQIRALEEQLQATQPVTTLVIVESAEPRMTTVFRRGNFLDQAEAVAPATPTVFSTLSPAMGQRQDRRTLAHWLIARNNPLTARVAVNRWWAQLFGRGIVETLEDFGTQGTRPTHPQLLDWLAVELMDSGWSMKRIHKLIVTSSVYRQTSGAASELLERDPYNHWYARAPRYRLEAETIRDNALAISGLLSFQLDGPPVYPPQPPGVWRHVGRNAPQYVTSQGADRFRRGIYVIWRRSAPYPSFTNFDAPDRASCVVQRSRTNTPLQALTLLNDPVYVELGLGLAQRVAARTDLGLRQRVRYAIRLCVAREPRPQEVEHLVEVYRRERQRFDTTPELARRLTASWTYTPADPPELAAWFFVANILLNLDETITRG